MTLNWKSWCRVPTPVHLVIFTYGQISLGNVCIHFFSPSYGLISKKGITRWLLSPNISLRIYNYFLVLDNLQSLISSKKKKQSIFSLRATCTNLVVAAIWKLLRHVVSVICSSSLFAICISPWGSKKDWSSLKPSGFIYS